MAREVSERQRQLLALLRESIRQQGRAPSLRELGERLGGVSPAGVHLQLRALAEKGLVRWPRGRPRLLELTTPAEEVRRPDEAALWRVPIVGSIAAGRPIEAYESPEGSVLVERRHLRMRPPAHGADLFALRVKGDSMVDACIQDGDIVVVRRQATADDGDTVVALLDGEQATLKRFFREAGRVRLMPANPYYPPIYAKEVQIQGKVVGVVRYC
jgi:repressor LexA